MQEASGTGISTTTFTVAGLSAPAEIVVDHWGVPHIYAADHYDAFFVQGFNAARDRLWQIDTWRRRGLGTLSEVFGAAHVEQDKAARLFLYRGDMYAEWLAYGSDAKRIAQAFTAGINAYVDLIDLQPHLMPPEFDLLDYRPARWQPEDVVRIRSNGLWRNVTNEVQRARLLCELGTETGLKAAGWWHRLEPDWQTSVPEGLDPCDIPANVLDLYLLATAPVSFPDQLDNPATPGSTAVDHRSALLTGSRSRALSRDPGSNNWVVAPGRSATGRPILADDPHRGHASPSLRYIAHLNAPGLDVIGAGEPALPGISIGHNQTVAFGLTIFPIDQEDLYVYRSRRGGYLYDGDSERIEVVEELINVRDGPPRPVRLEFTRHGPIVMKARNLIFAVRAAWLKPGMSPYFGSVEYMRAGNWREFVGALNRWGAPSENQVYADTDGNIGYKPAGLFPRRHNWDGLLPVPGDGRYEWDGFFDMDVLPEEFNPVRGFTGSANSMNLPPDYPIAEKRIGFEWSAPWRYRRLWEVLESQEAHDLTDSHILQRDYQSVLARELLARLPGSPYGNGPAEWLKDWDAVLSAESDRAAFFAVWYHRHLLPALAEHLLPGNGSLLPSLDSGVVLEQVALPANSALILATLDAAWMETGILLGQNSAGWRWGDLHQIRFTHPLAHLADPELAGQMAYQAYPRGGDANTTNNTGYSPRDFLVRSGASFRMVLDVGNWDDAEMTNAPGQSGDPRSPFYDNLLEGWAQEQSFPLLYSRAAVMANQALRIELQPLPKP
ncbi:MAG: penicillin acylase family protein [Pseudomonadales bacterium]